MKSLIICFSQTGNTRKTAERIRLGIMKVSGHCELINFRDVEAHRLEEYELVGLGCPVFYYQEPFNIRDFLRNLPPQAGRQWFVFCTHGSVMGNALNLVIGRLREKGALVIGFHDTYADGTLPFYPYPTLTTGHPDELDLKEAEEFGVAVAERSRRVSEGVTSLIPSPDEVPEDWVRTAEFLSLEFLGQSMPKLTINPDRCTHCGTCASECPVSGIDTEAEPPRIQQPCIYCYYCAKICPTLAIEADWEQLVQMAPQNYARYREALDDAVAKGKFRWLVSPDSMDFGNPLYKQREKEMKTAHGEA
ncbi:MAG: 4Fe-4S dicluster domain-containing protein [Candidatus Abyssobacteria bacterium SURF_5]|uniref:4Fe-4S dicluster domain-containing protein n=1 Tax=Abyssobacteria bacterium (strain SURF_5) TaxID=2093360 RepID=A0A3A4N689_ABYX5|nr:MAG: 4Fe-4S dicluster domain-containing protein [Candidatus Abyssubacteria bacterium SURF_5]